MANENPITFNELQALSGIDITQSIQDQIDGIGSTLTLDNGKIFIGNASNVPIDCSLSGGATINNTGTVTLDNAHVIAKLLTGYTKGAGTVASTDSLLAAIQKLDANDDAKLASASFTSAAVTAKVLTGLAAGANTPILATDTILAAAANLQAQITGFGAGVVSSIVRTNTSLAGAITCANVIRNTMVNHAASTTGSGAHPTPDTVSFAGIAAGATDLATLKTLVGSLLTTYAAHDADAKAGTPTYHVDGTYAGNDLTSVVAPTTLAECLTRLIDILAKFNAHDAAADAHTVASGFQVSQTLYTYTVLAGDYLVEASDSTGAWAINIPTALLADGKVIHFKAGANASGNNVTLSTQGAEDIDGADTKVISTNYGATSLYSDGVNWFTF